jgi:hypothetical protein
MDYLSKLLEMNEFGSWAKEVIIQDLRTISSENDLMKET